MPTNVNWTKVRNDFDGVVQQIGTPVEFRLRSGEVFTLQCVARFTPELALTEGMDQDNKRITVMANRWDAAAPAGREPQKGDQIVIDGRRFAVEEANPVLGGHIRIGWRIRLRG